ncbi:MAG: citrate:H+ symporter, partial [Lachnospiraceae bacterium]|nr:citrate:H+ symporter [Lachnospiraceae bacterium]
LATAMTGIFPEFLMKYMFLIFLILEVPIIHFVPYQVFNAMYPLFISVGATFGMGSIAIIAPFVCNLALATSATPMNSATYVGCTLCELDDVNGYCNYAGVIMFFTNLIVIVTALITGVLSF